MGKNASNQKPPETAAPAAVPLVVEAADLLPGASGDSSVDPQAPPPPDPPASEPKPLVYRANWKLDGLPSGNLDAGDMVELAEGIAAPLVESGVLSLVDTED